MICQTCGLHLPGLIGDGQKKHTMKLVSVILNWTYQHKENKMTRILRQVFFWFAISCHISHAQSDEWQNAQINQMNRLAMHAGYFAFSNQQQALDGQKEKSENFLSMNGLWKFSFVKDADTSRLSTGWSNPEIKLEKLEAVIRNNFVKVSAEYNMSNVSAKLYLTYWINNLGTVKIAERMIAGKEVNVSALPRFGMQMQMPYEFENIEYYGRGPMENYIDRNSAADLGIYHQTVDEQFYPYIYPQETGTKTDVRWWKQTNIDGKGLLFVADSPFSASALLYTIGALQAFSHCAEVSKDDLINICIDKVQMGLGCVHTWGAWPLDKYLLKYADYEFTFKMTPLYFR